MNISVITSNKAIYLSENSVSLQIRIQKYNSDFTDLITFLSKGLPPSQKEVMFLVECVCLFVCLWTTLLKMLQTDCDEILSRVPWWYNEKLIKCWW